MRVFLIGYMGVGKTTIGKKLANSLGLKFIDLDAYISSGEYLSIPQMMDDVGEEYFRTIEQQYLLKVAKMENVLVATGGGAPCFFDNMTVINNSGVSVYLKMDEKSLVQRLKNGMDSRPLLNGKSINELEEFVSQHLAQREPFYGKAKISFEALNFNAKKLEELSKQIRDFA